MADVCCAQNLYFENDVATSSSASLQNRGDTSRYAVLPEAAEGMDLDGVDNWNMEQSRSGEVPPGITSSGECDCDNVPVTFIMALPEGVSAGERLICLAPDGQKLRLTIPSGVPAGSAMNLSRDTTSGKWTCVIDEPDEPHKRSTYHDFHTSSACSPIASAVPPLHKSMEQLLRTSLQAAGVARPRQVHLSALHTPASSYGPSPCGSYVPSPNGSVSASPGGSYVPPPWPHHAAPTIAAATIRAAPYATASATRCGTLGLAPARAAPRVVTGGWGSNASSRHSSPASTPRARVVMPSSQSYTPPPVTPTPVMAPRGHSSSCTVAMPGVSQPPQSFSRSNSGMSMQYPAIAPLAVALHRQQSHASRMQGKPQAPRPLQPTKSPQDPEQNMKSWFRVAQQLPSAKQQQFQGQQKHQQPLLHQHQLSSRVPANRLTVKPVTQRRQRRSVCCAI